MGTNISQQLIYGNPFIWSNFILFCAPKFPKIIANLNIQKLVSVPCVIFPRNFEILVFPLVLYHFSKYVSTRKKHIVLFPPFSLFSLPGIELCLPRWRFSMTMVASFVVLGGRLLMPGVAYLCRNWQVLQAVIICPLLLMLSYIW